MKDLKEQFEKDLAICGVNALGLSSVALAAGEVSKNSIERNAREKEHALKLSFKAGIATELLPRVHNMLDDLQKNVPKK